MTVSIDDGSESKLVDGMVIRGMLEIFIHEVAGGVR